MCPRKPFVDRDAERILIHPEYDDDTLEFDIALVKIKAVKFTSHIQPVALPATQLAIGRKRRKLAKETKKPLERRTNKGKKKKIKIDHRNRLRKRKKLSESRYYPTQIELKERLKYLKLKRNLIKQNLNKTRTKRTSSKFNTILKEIKKLQKAIKEWRREQSQAMEYEDEGHENYERGCSIKKEQKKNKRITWYP